MIMIPKDIFCQYRFISMIAKLTIGTMVAMFIMVAIFNMVTIVTMVTMAWML